MRDLIAGFENLLVSTSMRGGDAREGADILLDAISWKRPLSMTKAMTMPMASAVVSQRLEEACTAHGARGSHAEIICNAILEERKGISWMTPWCEYLDHPDMIPLAQNFAFAQVVGPGGALECENVSMGISLQGPDLLYPMHAHMADETYWIIGGDADWKIGVEPWFPVLPGDICVHPGGMRHAMQTNAMPLLTVWAWWTNIESNIVMVRG